MWRLSSPDWLVCNHLKTDFGHMHYCPFSSLPALLLSASITIGWKKEKIGSCTHTTFCILLWIIVWYCDTNKVWSYDEEVIIWPLHLLTVLKFIAVLSCMWQCAAKSLDFTKTKLKKRTWNFGAFYATHCDLLQGRIDWCIRNTEEIWKCTIHRLLIVTV